MSLTSNIKTNKGMKEFLLRTMPKRETFSSNNAYPPFSRKNPLRVDRVKAEAGDQNVAEGVEVNVAESVAGGEYQNVVEGEKVAENVAENRSVDKDEKAAENEDKNIDEAGAIGILTDFMFRVFLAMKTGTKMNYRIAYSVIRKQRTRADFYDQIGKDSTYYRECAKVLQNCFDKYKDAIDTLIRTRGVGENNDAVVGMFFMARMEQVACRNLLGTQFFLDYNERIISESVQIRDLFRTVFLESGLVRNDSDVLLSPTFGKWGARIGGADADVFIDGTLYDFKSRRKSCGYRQGDVMQLWSYYLLNRLRVGGVESYLVDDGKTDEDTLGDREIKRLAIYFSRYGVIYSCPVAEISEEDLKEFAWLVATTPNI